MSKEEIPKDYDFKKEKEWEKKWEDENIYKYIGDGSRPRYVIDTPPPYPTGPTIPNRSYSLRTCP